jgi:hypothetical protein
MTLYRAQILLTPQQHQQLRQIAQNETRSISEVTRDLLDIALQQRKQNVAAQLGYVQRARETANRILQERNGTPIEIDLVSLMNTAKEERSHAISRA